MLCSHSIAHRLSKKLAIFTAIVIGMVSSASWFSVAMMVKQRNLQDLGVRCDLLADILSLEAQNGGETAVLQRLHTDAPMRARTRLEVWRPDGQLFYADATPASMQASEHVRAHEFAIDAPGLPGGQLRARYSVDFTSSAKLGARWAIILSVVTLMAGVVVALGSAWFVRRSLKPLNLLAAQTRAISPRQLDQRLALADPAEELSPWIVQFNALMDRLQQAYGQLEAFNADVAHELRTPLATLIGETEVALSRERSPQALRETLQSNLEEMQRLSALVNDMLFLSQADRGVTARRGAPVSLAGLAAQVSEFHEATLEDAGLALRIEGDATLPVDEPLVKRALSNLLGNATRFAEPGSTVVIAIAPAPEPQQVQVVVQNRGEAIAADHLPRLFDRFFRVDSARCCEDGQHHGLGLAIVAAIARMHAGRTVAESASGTTRVGFTLAT
ncbi:two-component sensor histidine kinase [Rubrivivax pictus]|uniref:Sensor protein n=2 Tax=Pseudaquabacterium pictum TaxID=2315236 RepID=A0A480B0B1_9BURK|nr:two-component sensor histidine kinase [Rubrivivax pictus]